MLKRTNARVLIPFGEFNPFIEKDDSLNVREESVLEYVF